jgi:uncharacterized protein YbjT (DUF2867 family)
MLAYLYINFIMQPKKALLLGASGLTGGFLLQLLLNSPHYNIVTIYVRKSLGIVHPKLVEIIGDFNTIHTAVEADDVFCCLGTTIKIAKTKVAFEEVDRHYPVKIAQLQKAAGSKHFLVISSMGADEKSAIFYSKTKGLMEKELMDVQFPALTIFRPALILGNRNQKRGGEQIAQWLFTLINPLLVGPLKNYAAIKASDIANGMLKRAINHASGTTIILSGDI